MSNPSSNYNLQLSLHKNNINKHVQLLTWPLQTYSTLGENYCHSGGMTEKLMRAMLSLKTLSKFPFTDLHFICLFDLILYVPSTIFQLNKDGSSWVEQVLS